MGAGDLELAQGVLRGDRLAISRAISLVESQGPQASELLAALYPHTGQAHLIGITGPPGTGKSTLVNQLARAYRQRNVWVGVVAVDPTSPLSGGALLGDRIRMRDLAGDPGVFIRSMATRGAVGGLATATFDAVQVLDAAGYQVVLIETTGVGQGEVAIAVLSGAKNLRTVVVVEAPGLGDDVQAIKAGLTEIADVFVVNKADRDGADQTARALELALDLAPFQALIAPAGPRRRSERSEESPRRRLAGCAETWRPLVCKTIALDGSGIPDLVSAIDAHRSYLLRADKNHPSDKMKEKETQHCRPRPNNDASYDHVLVRNLMSLRFFEISEAGIRIQNPFSEQKLILMGKICHELGYLQPGIQLLDLACGQGEMLCRWAQLYGITGTGVDLSEAFIKAARQRAEELGVTSQVEFVPGDACAYAQASQTYDVVSCLGATEIGGGTAGTVRLMRQALKDELQGLLLVGELFWNGKADGEAAKAMGIRLEDVPTLPALYDRFDQAGVQLLNMVLTDDEGWDRYQTHHWVKIHQWLRENPDDPDAAAFKVELEDWKRSYLVYRGHFGWGVFLLRVKE